MKDQTVVKAPELRLEEFAAEMANNIRSRIVISGRAKPILDAVCLRATYQIARSLEMEGLVAGRELYEAMEMSPPTAIKHARELAKSGQAWQSPRRMNRGTILMPKALALALGDARGAKRRKKIDIAKLRAALPARSWEFGVGRKKGGWHPGAKD